MKNKILNRLKRTICGFAAILFCFSLFSFTPNSFVEKDTVVNSFKLKTVIIDAGHGVKPTNPPPGHYSPGASGSFSNERNVTLAIALKLQKAIEKDVEGTKAVLTRSTEEDVSFERRAEIANQNKGNLFISIHCNSLSDRIVRDRVGTKRGKAVYKSVRVPDRSGKGVLMLVYGLHRSREEQNAIKNN